MIDKRLWHISIVAPEQSPGYRTTQQVKKTEIDGTESFEEIEQVVPSVDTSTVLEVPPGSDPQEILNALIWFTNTIEDLHLVPSKDPETCKLSKQLTPEPTRQQLEIILDDYRMLSPHYKTFGEIFKNPSNVKGPGLIGLLLESQARIIETLLHILPKFDAKKAVQLKEELPRVPSWVLRVIELWKEKEANEQRSQT